MFTLEGLFHSIVQLLIGLTVVGLLSVGAGIALATALRLRDLRWTRASLLIVPALLSSYISLCLPCSASGPASSRALPAWPGSRTT